MCSLEVLNDDLTEQLCVYQEKEKVRHCFAHLMSIRLKVLAGRLRTSLISLRLTFVCTLSDIDGLGVDTKTRR